MALDRRDVLGVSADMQDAAVDLGMEGLDATVEHLRKACQLGDIEDGKAVFAERPGRASGRDELDTVGGELTGEVDQAGLVGDAEERAADLLEAAGRIAGEGKVADETVKRNSLARRRPQAGAGAAGAAPPCSQFVMADLPRVA